MNQEKVISELELSAQSLEESESDDVHMEHVLIELLKALAKIRRKFARDRRYARENEFVDLLNKQQVALPTLGKFSNQILDYRDLMIRRTRERDLAYPLQIDRLIDMMQQEVDEIIEGVRQLEICISHMQESKDHKLTFVF